jgi:thymidylate synthase
MHTYIKADSYYIKNIKKILYTGFWDENPRTMYKDGALANSKYVIGIFESYDLTKDEFPITTLRPTAIKTGIKEIFWIYRDQSNCLDRARELGIDWWDSFDIGDGTIGQRYGATVKKYNLMDNLLESLAKNPFSRRHILNLYQYEDLKKSEGLYPCAYETIWSVRRVSNEVYLDLTLIQRSNDYLMAGYINKIQYVALQMMVAGTLGFKAGVFRHFVQNLHIYDRHLDAASEILLRTPKEVQPTLQLKARKSFYDYSINDFTIKDYKKPEKLTSKLELAL